MSDMRPVCLWMVLFGAGCTPYAATSARTTTTPSESTQEEFPLAERQNVPGTQASLQPPVGSERMPQGGGFVHARRRIQLLVIASDGPEWVHAQTLASVTVQSEDVLREQISLMGKPAELVVDRQDTGSFELERVRVYVRDGTRSVLAIGGYASDRSERLRGLVRASVLSLEWNSEAALNPEESLGARIAPSAPLALSRRSTSVLRYELSAVPQADPALAPAPTLSVFPVQVSANESEALEHCDEMLRSGVELRDEQVSQRGAVASTTARGCELRATQDISLPNGTTFAAHTYAAVLWSSGRSFLVMGMAPDASGETETWLTRFAHDARSLTATPLAPPSAETGE